MKAFLGPAVVGGLVAAVLAAAIVLGLRNIGRASQLADVVGAIVGLVACVISFASWMLMRSGAAAVDISGRERAERLADGLAILVNGRLGPKVRRSDLDLAELPVRWSRRPGLEDHERPIEIGRDRNFPRTGVTRSLCRAFASIPRERLVVVGARGSGKSTAILQFARDLLRQRTAGERVPVIISLSSWYPGSEDFRNWMAQRIGVDYYGGDSQTPQLLLDHGLLLPILDGLDEMSESQRRLAVESVDGLRSADAWVLTCRTDEYVQTVAIAAHRPSGTRVVELEPIRSEEAAEYLRLMANAETIRWNPVLDALRADRDAVTRLALTFRTPLMVFLASKVYSPKGSDPRELLDDGRFPTVGAIERHLLGGLLPVLYAKRKGSPQRWTGARVIPWFRFLAQHLQAAQTYDLAWWVLIDRVPRPMRIALSTLAFSAFYGAMATVLVVPTTLLRNGLDKPGLLVGLYYVLSATLPAGLGYAVGAELVPPPVPSKTQVGFRLRGPDRRALVVAILCFALAGLAIGGFWLAALFGVTAALIVILWAVLEIPIDVSELAEAVDTFGDDTAVVRTRSLVFWPAIMVVVFFLTNTQDAVIAGVTTGAAGGFISGMGTKAWGRFTIAQHWLAARRRLPWRAKRFLEDALERDALRRSGSMYQFRHGTVQEFLAK